jgi:hypothetical protein
VSAVLLNGPAYLGVMRKALADWMASKSFDAIDQARGSMSSREKDTELFERGNYIRTLQSWQAHADSIA